MFLSLLLIFVVDLAYITSNFAYLLLNAFVNDFISFLVEFCHFLVLSSSNLCINTFYTFSICLEELLFVIPT